MGFDEDAQPPLDGMANLMSHLMPASGQIPAPKRKSRVTQAGCKIEGMFELVRLRDSGRFGDVYEARQFSPAKRAKVAIKVLKREMMSADALRRFEREGQALTDLDHPGIPKHIHAGETGDERPYIAMEWVDGVPVTKWRREHAAGDWRIIVEVFIQVCEAIFHAHSIGIVHRDLKPSNILVTKGRDGRPSIKVVDFGIAKSTVQDAIVNSGETVIGAFMGTPDYMSPEQLDCLPGEVESRSDVYSLAAVLYELMTGRPPLVMPAGSSVQAWQKHTRTVKPGRASQMPGAIIFPRELDRILAAGLAKNKTERHATAADFARDLRLLLKGETSAAKRRRDQLILNRCTGVLIGLAMAAAAVALALVNSTPASNANVAIQAPIAPEREKEDLRNFLAILATIREGKPASPEQRLMEVRTALDIARPYIERPQPLEHWMPHSADVKRYEGSRLLEAGNLDEAEAVLEEGFATLKPFKVSRQMTPELREKDALFCHEMAAVFRQRKQCNGDIFWRRKELAIYERLTDLEDPGKVAGQRYICANLRYQLAVLLEKREPKEAAELIERAAQGHRAAYQSPQKLEQPHQVASRYCTTLEKRLQLAATNQDRSKEADSLRELIGLSEECFTQSFGADWGRLAAKSRAALARILETGGDTDGAREEYRAAVELGRRLLPLLNRPDFSRDLEDWTRKLVP